MKEITYCGLICCGHEKKDPRDLVIAVRIAFAVVSQALPPPWPGPNKSFSDRQYDLMGMRAAAIRPVITALLSGDYDIPPEEWLDMLNVKKQPFTAAPPA